MRRSTGLWILPVLLWISAGPSWAEPLTKAARDAMYRLATDSAGTAEIRTHRATGLAHLVRLAPGSIALPPSTSKSMGLAFLDRYGSLFGVRDAKSQLTRTGSRSDRLNRMHIRYGQRHEGVPVYGGELRAHLDPEGRLEAINGVFLADVEVDVFPVVTPERATTLATAVVAKDHARHPSGKPIAGTPRLMVYRDGVFGGHRGRDHLVWFLEVTAGAAVREHVLIDAHDGTVVKRIDGIHTINRRVSEGTDANVLWTEADPLPYSGSGEPADTDVNTMINAAGEIFRFVEKLSGGEHLSWNGTNGQMSGVYDPAPAEWDCSGDVNAYWNGRRTAFCPGMATDDIVAHEWGHAYTQGTHDLTGDFQIGALNESFSDILGEVVDILNGDGFDAPNQMRLAGGCSIGFGSPRSEVLVDEPVAARGGYPAGSAEFNPPPPWHVTAAVEIVDDGDSTPTNGCEQLRGFTAGRIALFDRGECTFVIKVQNAQNAGATGVIVVNDQGDELLRMGGNGTLDIPSLFLRQSDGEVLKNALDNGLVVTLATPSADDPSVRWVMGEDSVLEGIRDMWNPTCFNDPGKISDPEYFCGEEDSGGIHINAGVTNHAFALATDGGAYNGHIVTGIGLTKTSHVYWRAMSVYQVQLTDFGVHADAVEISCRDLVGATLTDLVTGDPSVEVITEFDCDQVDTALLAVEARALPVQCTELRLLDQDPPTDVGLRVAFLDNLDDPAPSGWTVSNEGEFSEYDPIDWVWSGNLPDGGAGGAFYAINSVDIGNCVAGVDDQSGVMHLDSPAIAIPTGSRPLLVFDHWFATESAFDGGNLKISVNGGDFELIEAGSFRFNPYNLDLNQRITGNTNPLSGEPAFSGTEYGTVRGSWAQSQVDLSAFVEPGDEVRIRFDFGVDGCNGRFGWYVDNVRISTDARNPRPGRRLGR